MRKLSLIILLVLSISYSAWPQEWVRLIDQGANFYEIKEAADEHFSQFKDGEKATGLKQYQRWEFAAQRRMEPNGDWPDANIAYEEYKKATRSGSNLRSSTFPQWVSKGPSVITGIAGLGRLNFLRFNPNDTNIMFVGAPSGGLWKSTDAGNTFTVLNDTLPIIGCSDLAINPDNDSIMYLGAGDRVPVGFHTFSNGIWKTTDGGSSWEKTSLSFTLASGTRVTRMVINPLNPDVVIATTSSGIYKTKDAGDTWDLIRAGDFYDLEYLPGDTAILYACGSQFVRSRNGGETFNLIGSGLPTDGRMEIAVTPANPSKVYLVQAKSSTGALNGVYISADTGASFTTVYGDSVNILGWNSDGSSGSGLGWYALAMSVSPIDEDMIFVGGVNTWRSQNGGSLFEVSSHWVNGQGIEYAHADCHFHTWSPSGATAYNLNDGGIYRSTDRGITWIDISNTLVITQTYRIGVSQHAADWFLMGNQDNNTNLSRGALGFLRATGADGMECIISHTNPNLMFTSAQNGPINRSFDGGNSFTGVFSPGNVGETSQWITTYVMDPFVEEVLYAGYRNIYKTTNFGTSWSKINDNSFPAVNNVSAMAIHKWWPDKILATKGNNVYASTDAGVTWSRISNATTPTRNISYVAFDNNDLTGNTLWATYTGYVSGFKCFKTTDFGATWTDESAGLPGVSAWCVLVDDEGTGGGTYVGTEIGVYYKNDTMSQFVPYMNGLPNVSVFELEIQKNTKKLIAGTFGRGIWETDLLITGLETYSKKNDLELLTWPNPTSGTVNIRYDGLGSNGTMAISDLNGRTLIKRELSPGNGKMGEMEVDLGSLGLNHGIYFIQLSSGTDQIVEKIIIR